MVQLFELFGVSICKYIYTSSVDYNIFFFFKCVYDMNSQYEF